MTAAGRRDLRPACLEGFVDRYLDAVRRTIRSWCRWANARYTEDGQHLEVGDGLWRTMHAKALPLFVDDVPAGEVAFFGTLEEENRDPTRVPPCCWRCA